MKVEMLEQSRTSPIVVQIFREILGEIMHDEIRIGHMIY